MVEWKSIKITNEDYNKLLEINKSPSQAISCLLSSNLNKENNKKLTDENFLKEIEKILIDTANLKNAVGDNTEQINKIQEVIEKIVKLNSLKMY